MALSEKLSDEELCLIEVIRHPIFFSEFIRNLDIDPEVTEEWEHTDYQKEILCDFADSVSMCCARAVGKTEVLRDKLIWLLINKFYEDSIVFTVPNRVHLEPPFLKISRWFRSHSFLKWYIDKNGINASSYMIKLLNGAVLDCRIAGTTGGGANVVGLHTPFILLDEGSFYPWGTWIELQPTWNTFQKGHQIFVSGVPDGRREKSVLYYADQIDSQFTKHRITAHQNPRYSEKDEERNLRQFKSADSEEYLHFVLGQHGSPSYSMFDRSFMAIERYEIFTDKRKGAEFSENSQFIYSYVSSLPQLPQYYDAIIFGIDLGYTEPTVITILYRLKEKFYFHSRLTFYKLDYPIQEKLIDLLDTKYSPSIIGIDAGAGGSGKSVIQHLMLDDPYLNKNYKSRVGPIEFGGKTSIGFDDAGEEVFVNTKQYAMQKLQSIVGNKELIFSFMDDEFIGELERIRYTKTESGNLKFTVESFTGKENRGEDHNTASVLGAIMAWHDKYELNFNLPVKRLYRKFSWL